LPGADIVGNYKAWLSDSTGSPSSRFRRSGKPYVLPVESSSGQAHQVADDWTDLTTCDGSGCLDHAITVTESGATVGFEWAWTHTLTDGTAEASGFHCGNWQSNEGDFFKPDAVGDFGETNNSGTSWTNNNATACDALIFLYCFQQT